ncbi:hypothetical protein TNCV_3501021 [Trichonephila clavipes]|nr:hypothetical protein TNCV_3501021 [Trichonephila clavipes]
MLRLVFESDPHVCRGAATVPGKVESGVPVACPLASCFSCRREAGVRSPLTVNRLVISSADSNTGSFGIPKTVALGLVLQLGVPWVNWRITSRTCEYYTPVPPLEVSAVPDACQDDRQAASPCWSSMVGGGVLE